LWFLFYVESYVQKRTINHGITFLKIVIISTGKNVIRFFILINFN